jgi:CubicO group peptidase (beta-lactamase class C family)
MMSSRRVGVMCAIVFACVAAAVGRAPQTGAVGPPVEARIARVERGLRPAQPRPGTSGTALLSDRMAFYATPGVSIAVIDGGAVEWARGYGVTHAGSGDVVTPRTLFQAASISKPVTAFAALRLVEQGVLSLDEDVNTRLRSWKVPENEFTRAQKVTLRRLLSHTAGLTVHGFPGYGLFAAIPSLVQVLDGRPPANTAAVRVELTPGTEMRYSGGGFTVLQQLLVDVSGKPFPALASELALQPIGMHDSTYEQPLPAGRTGSAAWGHRQDGQAIPGRFHTYPEMAAAGLWTTPTDLAAFVLEVARAARGESALLGRPAAREMLTEVKSRYGLGLTLAGSGAAASFAHGGANEGFRCQMVGFVESGRGAVVMTNSDRGGDLAQEILGSIVREYGWPPPTPPGR